MRPVHVMVRAPRTREGWLAALAACALLALCGVARAQPRSAAEFPQPQSRCVHAAAGQVLTRVGSFAASDGTAFEVVTDVRLRSGPLQGNVDFNRPSVSVFDADCTLIWHQAFNGLLVEAGFETLALPGGTSILHVAAVSEPPVHTMSAEELLLPAGFALMPFGPNVLGRDRYDSSYIGPLDGGFGIVRQESEVPRLVEGKLVWSRPIAQLYRWQGVHDPQDPHGPLAYGFAMAPETLDPAALAALHLPSDPPQLPFPLRRFVLEADGDPAPPEGLIAPAESRPAADAAPPEVPPAASR